MQQDLRSVLTALAQRSPVVVTDVSADVRHHLLLRYIDASTRNGRLAIASVVLLLFGVAYEAPLLPRIVVFAVLMTVLVLRSQRARDLMHRLDPAEPRSDLMHDVLMLVSALMWGFAPLALEPWVSAPVLSAVLYASVIALAMLAVSYVAALPACFLSVVLCGLPLVGFMLMQGSPTYLAMALGTGMMMAGLFVRIQANHATLLMALAAERENAALVKELEGYRRQLENENAALGDSLRSASAAASHDALTGLFNRRYLSTFAQPLTALVLEEREAVTVLMVDIDHFKRVNDTHGHPVGDAVLCSVGQLLGARLRDRDCLARYGGEEFVIVLRRCDVHRGHRVAEALRHNVASAEIDVDDLAVPVTISIGVAQWAPGEDLDDVIQRADRALYRAKQNGRDRVDVDARDALNHHYASGADSTLPGQLH